MDEAGGGGAAVAAVVVEVVAAAAVEVEAAAVDTLSCFTADPGFLQSSSSSSVARSCHSLRFCCCVPDIHSHQRFQKLKSNTKLIKFCLQTHCYEMNVRKREINVLINKLTLKYKNLNNYTVSECLHSCTL